VHTITPPPLASLKLRRHSRPILRSIASALLVLKDVEAHGPVSERHAHTYGSFCVFDALRMDVQNRADYAFEVDATIRASRRSRAEILFFTQRACATSCGFS